MATEDAREGGACAHDAVSYLKKSMHFPRMAVPRKRSLKSPPGRDDLHLQGTCIGHMGTSGRGMVPEKNDACAFKLPRRLTPARSS